MVGPDLHTTAPAAAADQDAAGFEHLHCLTQYLAAYADPLRQVCLRTQPFLTTLAQAPGLVRQQACNEDRETTLAGRYRPRQMFPRSEEHTSELQSLMRISYAVFCLKKKKNTHVHIISVIHRR